MFTLNRNYLFLPLLAVLSLFNAEAQAACDDTLPTTGTRDDVLVIVNDNSIDSCEVGRYYAQKRGLGKNNILHVRTPADYFINWTHFKILRDQIIQRMQQRIALRDPAFTPVVCTDGDMPFYCQASMDQLRANTRISYIVMTKGMPSRVRVDGSKLWFSNAPTSIDNYLKYWLINYFADDTAFGSLSGNRAIAFADGRNIRPVVPATDRELIVGRIDGISLQSARALVDRSLDAEANGLYGKVYTYTNYGPHNAPTGMRWKDYSKSNTNIYDGSGDPWRYQLGLFGESAPECSDYLEPGHYLNFSQTDSRGKAPQNCTVKLSSGINRANDLPPARAGSRQPLVDDAFWYAGLLDGQSTTGNFREFLNWRRDTSCSNTLCADLPAGEQAACRAASVDVYKEIDTRCVGVSDGFIGYNYQSFPVSFLHIAPTGWNTGTAEGYKTGRAIVREDSGFDDNMSLWYRNNEEIASPSCYASSDFSQPPSAACASEVLMNFNQTINFTTTQTSDPISPDQYRLRFKYNAENLSKSVTLKAYIQVTELASNTRVTYRRVNASLAIPANTSTGWQDGEAIITFDHSNSKHSADWDGTYKRISVYLASSTTYAGGLGIDTVSLEKLDPAGIAAPTPIALVNPSFDQGHQQVTTGDHAANFLSRLNGVAFWGSLSHHQSGGHSFSRHTLETMVYFMRGLPLGDAVWFGENYNSGILYGDPLYSPVAIKLADINKPYDFITTQVALQGHTVNGRDPNAVATTYQVDYCPGDDFFVCDRQASWISTGLAGTGGTQNTNLGIWTTTGLSAGAYTLRLAVTSNNINRGRNQTFYDYYPVVVANQTSDFDADGVSDLDELNAGMNPTSTDSDGDGLSDGDEIAAGTDPLRTDSDGDGLTDGNEVLNLGTDPLNTDTDGDKMPDGWEASYAGLDPLVDDAAGDLDADGLTNLEEYGYSTNPIRTDTDRDRIDDGEEVANGTDPVSNLDTDLDGMSNDWERIRGTRFNFDDARTDSDGDGVDNIIEFTRRTLPLDASSVPPVKTLHVDAVNGDDTNGDGSASLPFASLTTAMTAARAGDTIQLAAGNYSSTSYLFMNKMVTLQGPADRSAVINRNWLYINGIKWGGFSNLKLNVSSFLNLANARNLLLSNVELGLDTPFNLARDAKAILKHVLVTNLGGATSAFAAVDSTGFIRTHLEIHNSTITGFPLGIDWNKGVYLRVRDSILANAVDLQDAYGFNVWNSLISDGQFTSWGTNLAGDPGFVDAANGDYHLRPISPAIDTANPYASASKEPSGYRLNMGFYGNTAEAATAVDSDGDGMPDGWEIAVGLDPNLADQQLDTDNDGLVNLLEYKAGSNPLNKNSRRGPQYYFLNPALLNSSIDAMALVDGTYMYGRQYARLNQFERVTIDTTGYSQGTRFYSNQPVSFASSTDGTDMPVVSWMAGHEFVIPHFRFNHEYYITSPYGNASVTVTTDTRRTFSIGRGKVITVNGGSLNTLSAIIRSDLPILVSHAARISATSGPVDAYAVPPVSKEIMGIYSRYVILGAVQDNTRITLHKSDGSQQSLLLNAGGRYVLPIDNSTAQGQGVAMHIVADKPIAAIQAADSDGIEATAFWDPVYFGRRYGLPIDSQYLAVACKQAATIELYSNGAVVDTRTCSPSGKTPGKAYFGQISNGTSITAGQYLISDQPVYLIFESSSTNDEKNLLGRL